MAATYRIAVIGDWQSVMGFRALGLDTYPVTGPEEARERLARVFAILARGAAAKPASPL